MTYRQLYEDAINKLNHGMITVGEYEKMIEPLNKEIEPEHTQPDLAGRWVGANTQCGIACSICKAPVDDFCGSIDYVDLYYAPNFCPNCGARMECEHDE